MITEGIASFINLAQPDVYDGKPTEWYNITLTLEEKESEKLRDEGVLVNEYKNQGQRQFKTKHPIEVVDVEGEPMTKNFPYGSKVRVQWSKGPEHPKHKHATYLQKVRVLEMAEGLGDDDEF